MKQETPQEYIDRMINEFHSLSITIHILPRTYKYGGMTKDNAKQCVIIHVKETLENLKLPHFKVKYVHMDPYFEEVLESLES